MRAESALLATGRKCHRWWPAFLPTATEAGSSPEHRWVLVEGRPENAGHAEHTVFVDAPDAGVGAIAGRGIERADQEAYSHGVRKMTYRDRDRNDMGFGGFPPDRADAGSDRAPGAQGGSTWAG